MILAELHGYKRYADKTFSEILQALGQYVDETGANSVVVVPRDNRNYVYKAWMNDLAYEAFYKLAVTMQGNKYIPKLGPIRRLPLFFKRQGHVDGHINIVKMEKLERSLKGVDQLAKTIHSLLDVKIDSAPVEQVVTTFLKGVSKTSETELSDDADLIEVCVALKKLYKANPKFINDVSGYNIMLRGSQPVIIDPFCTSFEQDEQSRNDGVLFMDDLKSMFDGEPAVLKSGSRTRIRS